MSDFWRVLVTGSREWADRSMIHEVLDDKLFEHEFITVIHGDCPTGADLHARGWAEESILADMRRGEARVRHEAYPAFWDELGKSAGPIRNKYMVMLDADECIAFPTASSRGTVSCMKLAQAAGIPVINYGVEI